MNSVSGEKVTHPAAALPRPQVGPPYVNLQVKTWFKVKIDLQGMNGSRRKVLLSDGNGGVSARPCVFPAMTERLLTLALRFSFEITFILYNNVHIINQNLYSEQTK